MLAQPGLVVCGEAHMVLTEKIREAEELAAVSTFLIFLGTGMRPCNATTLTILK